jgi:hypothetical protein
MIGLGQFGIAIGALGFVLTTMGLFPGMTGLTPGEGVGIVQFALIMIGLFLLIFGALTYVKFTFYQARPANLAQQIGVRLALTGLVLAAMAGLADFFGFGSHARAPGTDVFFGPLQAVSTIGGFLIASLGVVIYAMMGVPPSGRG